jgi:hypothetical protein
MYASEGGGTETQRHAFNVISSDSQPLGARASQLFITCAGEAVDRLE